MVGAGGIEYATIGALSYRQVLGDNSVMWYNPSGSVAAAAGPHTVQAAAGSRVGGASNVTTTAGVIRASGSSAAAVAVGGTLHDNETPLKEARATVFMFVKGLGSSGDTGTIDDNYPAALFYLWRNPALLNALLQVKRTPQKRIKPTEIATFFQ
jgi:hypothetical protein